MRLTNGDIYLAFEALNKLVNLEFPVETSYELAKMIMKLNEQWKVVEMVRNSLIRKYGEEDESKKIGIRADSPNYFKFVNEFNELMLQEIDIEFERVKISERAFENNGVVKPSVFIALDKFVEILK